MYDNYQMAVSMVQQIQISFKRYNWPNVDMLTNIRLGYQSRPRSSQSSASSSVTSSVAAAVSSTPASKQKRTTLEKIRTRGTRLRQTLPSTMVRRKRDGGRPMSPFHLLRRRIRTISSCQICERNIQVLPLSNSCVHHFKLTMRCYISCCTSKCIGQSPETLLTSTNKLLNIIYRTRVRSLASLVTD